MNSISEMMDTYKFHTTVLEEGIIQIPDFENLVKKNVEVTLVVKHDEDPVKPSLSKFLAKWSGAFSNFDAEDARYNYLMKKHK